MSDCWKCDKCGQYHTKDDTRFRVKTEPDEYMTLGATIKTNDLCEACDKRFRQWLCDHPQFRGSDYLFFAIDEWPVYYSKDTSPYGWPVFEDGSLVKEGDEVLDKYGHGFVAHNFSHCGKWWTISSGHGYSTRSDTLVFKRPTKDQMANYYNKWPGERKEKKQQPNYVGPVIRIGADAVVYDGEKWKSIGYVADGGLEMTDDVNHPKHYDNGTVECIDWIEDRLSPEEFKGYLLGNALKYSFRYEDKGKPVEDLRKAQWYLKKLEELA